MFHVEGHKNLKNGPSKIVPIGRVFKNKYGLETITAQGKML